MSLVFISYRANIYLYDNNTICHVIMCILLKYIHIYHSPYYTFYSGVYIHIYIKIAIRTKFKRYALGIVRDIVR